MFIASENLFFFCIFYWLLRHDGSIGRTSKLDLASITYSTGANAYLLRMCYYILYLLKWAGSFDFLSTGWMVLPEMPMCWGAEFFINYKPFICCYPILAASRLAEYSCIIAFTFDVSRADSLCPTKGGCWFCSKFIWELMLLYICFGKPTFSGVSSTIGGFSTLYLGEANPELEHPLLTIYLPLVYKLPFLSKTSF